MKKLILLFILLTTLTFSLEITNMDPIDFGVVVEGDREVSMRGMQVEVKGTKGKKVEIIVPERYDFKGNTMEIRVREKTIILDDSGRGKFQLDIKLLLTDVKNYQTLTDKLRINVKYTK